VRWKIRGRGSILGSYRGRLGCSDGRSFQWEAFPLAFLMRDYGRTVRMRPFEKRKSSATFWRAILGLGPVSFVGRVWFSRAASLGITTIYILSIPNNKGMIVSLVWSSSSVHNFRYVALIIWSIVSYSSGTLTVSAKSGSKLCNTQSPCDVYGAKSYTN
jgi:hypothetical protein